MGWLLPLAKVEMEELLMLSWVFSVPFLHAPRLQQKHALRRWGWPFVVKPTSLSTQLLGLEGSLIRAGLLKRH